MGSQCVGGGYRKLRPMVVGVVGGVADWHSGISWPHSSKGFPFSCVQTPPPLLPSPSSSGTKKPTSQDGGHPSSAAGTACWTGSFLQRLCLVGKDPSSSPSAWALTGGLLSPPWFPPPSSWTWFQNLGHKPAGTDGCRLEGQAAPQGGHSDSKKRQALCMVLVWESYMYHKNPGLAPEGRPEISGQMQWLSRSPDILCSLSVPIS